MGLKGHVTFEMGLRGSFLMFVSLNGIGETQFLIPLNGF